MLGDAARDHRHRRGRRCHRAGGRTAVRRPAARRHRREHAGAHSRPAADGGVEQVRRVAAHHREQVGDVGRVRDALRRHVRRLFRAKDLYKTEVYALSQWRNRLVLDGALGPAGEVIPQNVLAKAPTAELRPEPKGSGLVAGVRRARRDAERPRRGRAERPAASSIAGFDRARRHARPAHALSWPNTSAARRLPV